MGILWRLYQGKIGIKPSAEFRFSSEGNGLEGIFSLPVEVDYFFFIRDTADIYAGIFADLTDSGERTVFPRYGINLGAAYLGRRQTWYFDNRLFIGPEIRYSPQIGIRY